MQSGEPAYLEYRLRLTDGRYRWFRARAAARRDAAGRIVRWYGTVEDIHDAKQDQARIAYMAHHDQMTGLANRALFQERLGQELARIGRGSRLAVLNLDLDNFKAVNDALGHAAGDMLLRQVADRLSACVRETDTVARLGGDEFAILQVVLQQPDGAATLAQRIMDALGKTYDLDGHVLAIGTSIGIALSPEDGAQSDALLGNADLALYRAKADGRGTYRFFESRMGERLQARQALKLDLRGAVAREEFDLAYQPLVDLRSGEVSGFEALVRWRHPGRGTVSPAEFIPLAEETGVIGPLGEWVLRRACREAARWPGRVGVAVNLSAVQFRDRALPRIVEAALAASGLAPRRLELEITESVPLLDDDANLAVLHGLRALGVRIAMDDFGTGYSSLAYLHRFPFDKLKIDRSLVSLLSETEESQAIVRAIIGLSRALRIATTAEGVETRQQLDLLRAEGCDQAQGFLLSHPVPASEVLALIEALQVAAAA